MSQTDFVLNLVVEDWLTCQIQLTGVKDGVVQWVVRLTRDQWMIRQRLPLFP